MVVTKTDNSYSIIGIEEEDLFALNRIIDSAPLPDKRVLYNLKMRLNKI